MKCVTLFALFTAVTVHALEASPLATEGLRELAKMRTSAYQHATVVIETTGRFDFDCSGFLDYALKRALPAAYLELPISKPRDAWPLARDFYDLFAALPRTPKTSWIQIPRAIDLEPGDIIAWLRPDDVDSKNTGHVMLVREKSRLNPEQPGEVLVRVVDSSRSAHADDTRHKNQTGLGSGVVGLLVNERGQAIGYRWRGGLSRKSEFTPVALGRAR